MKQRRQVVSRTNPRTSTIWARDILTYDMIYLTAIGLTPGGSSTVHIYTQTIHITNNRHKQYIQQHSSLIRKSADRATSWQGIPWHLPYNWRKSTENPHTEYQKYRALIRIVMYHLIFQPLRIRRRRLSTCPVRLFVHFSTSNKAWTKKWIGVKLILGKWSNFLPLGFALLLSRWLIRGWANSKEIWLLL
jgi:hypothetical protein